MFLGSGVGAETTVEESERKEIAKNVEVFILENTVYAMGLKHLELGAGDNLMVEAEVF